MNNLVKQKKLRNNKVLFFSLFIFVLFSDIYVLAADEKWDWDYETWNYEDSLKEKGLMNTVTNYLRKEKITAADNQLDLKDYVVLLAIDTVLALICLYAAIYFTSGKKGLSPETAKTYIWFLFIFNIAWFIFMIFFNVVWKTFEFFLINLQPSTRPALMDYFSIAIIIAAVSVYIWLLARTFSRTCGLGFYGAVSVFLLMHLFYFLIVFVLSLQFWGGHNILRLIRENLGAKVVLRSYLSDSNKITSGRDMLEFFRFRPFHI